MLRNSHRLSAVVIGAFAALHLVNHLAGLAGGEAHIAFMHVARSVYRSPIVEAVLLSAVGLQVFSGLSFVVRGWKERRGFVPWLQAGSGAYLAVFFLIHVGAVLYGRAGLHLDTNFYYAAAGFHVPPFQLFFAPYYFLAVLSLFTHLGCALFWQLQTRSRAIRMLAVALPSAVGGVVALLIVLLLAGVFSPVRRRRVLHRGVCRHHGLNTNAAPSAMNTNPKAWFHRRASPMLEPLR